MPSPALPPSLMALLFAAFLPGGAGNARAEAVQDAPRCQALARLPQGALPNPTTVVTSAALAPDPEHCEVFGELNRRTGADGLPYAIRFHLRLPSAWNGRFFFQGGGGTNGNLGDARGTLLGRQPGNALALGYAVVSQDAGHDNSVHNDPARGGTLAFAFDPQARLDFGYNSYDEVARTAKALVAAYYGQGPRRSYYVGCSEGGREGMMMSQRFPDAFDGVLSVAPGLRLPAASLAGEVWDLQAFAEAARAGGHLDRLGQPLLNKSFTDRDLELVAEAVLAACDGRDGLTDGIIDDFPACRSEVVAPKLSALACAGAKTETCLTREQVAALRRVFDGARDANGRLLYADWPWDSGIGDRPAHSRFEGWRRWKLGTFESDANDALNATLGAAAAGTLFTTPPQPAPVPGAGYLPYALGLDVERGASATRAISGPYAVASGDFMMASSTDLSRFAGRGGKLLIVHGVSDPVFSINDTIDWWEKLDQARAGRAAETARLFAVPGMAHCGTGPATDEFDAFGALVQWVEDGTAPDRINARAGSTTPWPGRTRPLCPFPTQARYRGEGSIEDAANFVCQ